MTETILDVLDKQVIMSPGSQQIIKEIPNKDDRKVVVHSTQDIMPDISTQRGIILACSYQSGRITG